MTRTLNQIIAALMCLSIFAGATRAGVIFSFDIGHADALPEVSTLSESSHDHSNHESVSYDDNADDNPMNHRLFPDQLLKVNVTLDAAPQEYHLELTVAPHIDLDDDDDHENGPDIFTIDIGVNIDGEFTGVITFDAANNEWQTGWLNVGQLSGDVSVTLDWLKPPPFDDDTFLKIRPLVFTPVVPAPATVVFMLTSFGFAASRRRRE